MLSDRGDSTTVATDPAPLNTKDAADYVVNANHFSVIASHLKECGLMCESLRSTPSTWDWNSSIQQISIMTHVMPCPAGTSPNQRIKNLPEGIESLVSEEP